MKKLMLLLVLLVSTVTYSQIPTTDLIAEYKFSDASLDDTGGSVDLVQTGSALIATSNRSGGTARAIELNGDYLQRTTNTAGEYDLSVSFWIKTATNDANKRVIIDQTERTTETETSSQTGWYAYLKDGKIGVAGNFQWAKQYVNIVSGTVSKVTGYTGYLDTNSATDISDGNWHHVTITIFTNDGERQSGTAIRATYKVYIDNSLEATQSQTYTAPDHPWSRMERFVNLSLPITIANSKDGNSTNYFQESIDDIRFYSSTIDDTDVSSLYSETICAGSTSVTATTKDIIVHLDATGNATIVPEDVNDGSEDSCGDPITNFSLDISSFTCDDLGANTVMLTAEDIDGNTSTASATVTIQPSTTVLMKSEIVAVQLDGTGNASISPGDVDDGTFSSCGETLTLSLDQSDFTCADVGSDIVVTLTATDGYGNSETGTATVRIEDVSEPTVTAQDIEVQLNASTGAATITTGMVDDGTVDNCSFSLSLSKTEFTCSDIGENIVTLTATDDSGNESTAEATVTVTTIINDETITASNAAFCPDGTTGTTISTGSSVVGVDYFLRNSEDNAVVDGPIAGTGSALDFNTGLISSTTTYNVYGETVVVNNNNALSFDGTNDHVNAGNDNRGISTQITLAMWIKSTVSAAQYFLGKYDGINGVLLYFDANGKLHVDGRDGTGVYKQSGASITSVNDGEWHYVAGTINLTTGVWSVYVDGVLENSTSNATGSTLASTADLTFGAHTTLYFNGNIDQLTIWNIALDASTIQSNMNSTLTGSETGIVALYELDEASGSTVGDDSSSGINGSMTNMDPSTDWVEGRSLVNSCGAQMSTEIIIGDSEAPTVVVKNITIPQSESGSVQIDATDIDNGSSDNCTLNDNLVFSLDKSEFGCSEVGEHTVTLTVTDENGNSASQEATVTITSIIQDQTVTATQSSVCPGSSTTISLVNSQTDLNYYLRNELDEVVDGPIVGTGQAIEFNTGSISNTTTFNVFGEFMGTNDEAMKLAGSSGFVDIPTSGSLQLDANWTIEAWVKPTSATADMNIVETYDASGGFILRAAAGSWMAYAMFNSSSYSIVSAFGVEANQWTHVAATFNETTNELTIYVNGVLSATNSSATIDQRGSTATIKIGARGDDSRVQGEHIQDEVRIWNVERTEQEILDNKSTSLNGDEPGLVAYYDFNDLTFTSSGMVIPDRTSNNNSGTVVGAYTSENLVDGAFTNQAALCGKKMTTTPTIVAEDNEAPIAIAKNITVRLGADNTVGVFSEDVNNGSFDGCGSITLDLEIDNSSAGRGPSAVAPTNADIEFNDSHLGDNQVILTVTDENGNTAAATATVTVEPYKTAQTITFPSIATKTYGGADFSVSATASSELTVQLSLVSGPAELTDNSVTITGAGTVVIEASQTGDDEYAPADPVQQSFEVSKAELVVTADDQTISYGDQLPTLTFSYEGFVNGDSESDLTSAPGIATSIGKAEGLLNAGTYDITLSGGISDNYAFTLNHAILTVSKADQVITLTPIGDKEPTADPFDIIATVDSNLPLTYDVTGPATISGNTVTLNGTDGEVTVIVSQTGDNNHNATSISETINVRVPLGADDLMDRITIYPNPVVDYLVIDMGESVSLRFFTLEGKLSKTLQNVHGRVDVQGLTAGTYLLQISGENQHVIKKIIKAN